MLEIVRQQLLEDQQRSNKIANYSINDKVPIWQLIERLFDQYVHDSFTGDINDTSLAITITDGIYNLLP